MPQHQPSGTAVGFMLFAAVMMMLIGVWQAIAGLAAVIENEFYIKTPNYFLELDVSTWGWIHLILGIIILLAGFGVLGGAVWARTVGVLLAGLSAISAFAFIPYHPVWSVVVIAVDVMVIWALTAHGRDAMME